MKKYYCDTNIFLRILLNDNPRHKRHAQTFIQNAQKENIQLVVTSEIFWEIQYILNKYYKVPKPQIISYLKTITSDESFTLEQPEIMTTAILVFEELDIDFVDSILVAKQQLHNTPIATFDRQLALTSPTNLILQSTK